ncbi:MAG: M20/M25/M40 family metallo-hydrolase, partial [Bacteroidales bacterium]|nr:M20/M25/M40 family metallo-hydrolase [Bacteroidales bacterium]
MIDLLKSLIKIPSFSREESAAVDCLEAWLKEHNLPVQRKGTNLWLKQFDSSDDKPVILLNAHIDTVKPAGGYTRDPFTPTQEGDFLYGLGSNDDGGSLVALLQTYINLTSKPQPYNLIWSATSEEEVCGRAGIDVVFEEFGRVDLGIIGEPTGMRMAVAEKGLMVLDCTAHGKSGHAARNEGINALYEALKSIDWFRSHQFEKVSPYLGPVKMTVTMINAGTQHNVVPDTCTFVVDVRPNGMYSNVELLGLIKEAVTCDVKERSTRINSSHIEMDHPV